MDNFINKEYINELLENAKNATEEQIGIVLNKAKNLKKLSHEEVAILLQIRTDEQTKNLYEAAGHIKNRLYGNRVVLFAPLYVSNYCTNNCTYCGYKRDNKFPRTKLNQQQISDEIKVLEKLGHKRLALEVGEDKINSNIDYVLDTIDWIYQAGDIRRINVNIAATTVENYKRLKEKEIGTYILFQETYDKDAFEKYHPKSLKGNYERQLYAHHNAMEAGIDDVGGGVLFGLADYKVEVLSLLLHNEELENKYNVGFHTISVPRLQKAEGMDLTDYQHLITDDDFKKIVTILRLAVPYTGLILSTRESKEIREQLIECGITQISAGSQTGVGGYKESEKDLEVNQFELSDERSPIEIIKWLLKMNYLPSYCTACYRMGRTGDHFMDIVKAGKIGSMCHPNALMTLSEYVRDFGDNELLELSNIFIENEITKIDNEVIRKTLRKNLIRISKGESDLYV